MNVSAVVNDFLVNPPTLFEIMTSDNENPTDYSKRN